MAKDIISAYRNVCRDLEGLKAYEPIARRTLERQHEILFTGKADRLCHLRVDQQIPHYNGAVEEYNETVEHIHLLTAKKQELERLIGHMSEPEQIVVLLHVEQGLNLREIADKTNYSYGHLRNIAYSIKNRSVIEMMAN